MTIREAAIRDAALLATAKEEMERALSCLTDDRDRDPAPCHLCHGDVEHIVLTSCVRALVARVAQLEDRADLDAVRDRGELS